MFFGRGQCRGDELSRTLAVGELLEVSIRSISFFFRGVARSLRK